MSKLPMTPEKFKLQDDENKLTQFQINDYKHQINNYQQVVGSYKFLRKAFDHQ